MSLRRTVAHLLRHPLNRGRKLSALRRYLGWQIGSRLVGGKVAVPFVDHARLLVARGMVGATGNIYCGLADFEDMAFLLHLLRAEDLFVDIGANIGSYTVLAAAVRGARTVAFEPAPAAYAHLLDNLRLNATESRVDARRAVVGSESGTTRVTAAMDAVNHVATAADDARQTIVVDAVRLDELGLRPTLIKIDVEGFESSVITGGEATLRSPGLLAVIIELNGSGARYGIDDETLDARLRGIGFASHAYQPWERRLTPCARNRSGNTLYVRDAAACIERLASAPRFSVLGREL